MAMIGWRQDNFFADNLIDVESAFDYYVSPTGNDTTGTGTATNPYLTITKAVSRIIYSAPLTTITIHIADGTYTESVTIPTTGTGSLIFVGNASTPDSVVWKAATAGSSCLIHKDNMWFVTISGVRLQDTATAISMDRARLTYNDIHVYFSSTGILAINNSIVRNTSGTPIWDGGNNASSVAFVISSSSRLTHVVSNTVQNANTCAAISTQSAFTFLGINHTARTGSQFAIYARDHSLLAIDGTSTHPINITFPTVVSGSIGIQLSDSVATITAGSVFNTTNAYYRTQIGGFSHWNEGNTCTFNDTTVTTKAYCEYSAEISSQNYLGTGSVYGITWYSTYAGGFTNTFGFDVNYFLQRVNNTSSSGALDATIATEYVDATAGTVTRTLPSAVTYNGKIYCIKKKDATANAVNIATTGGQTIEGVASPLSLTTQNQSAMIQSNGTNWVYLATVGFPTIADNIRSATTTINLNAASAPSAGQVLTATDSTHATWQNNPAGFADPMTTAGDMIYRNGSNVTARLPLGLAGKVLKSDGTTLSWEDGAGDVSSNTITSVDSEVVLFSSITGKMIKRATGTGLAKLTSGVLSMAAAGSDYTSPTGSESLTNKTITDSTNNITAKALFSATTTVSVVAATAPTTGQVLTATDSTHATWQTPVAGFSDPMTTRGDIIYRNASNVSARLPIGTSGQVLRSDGTDLAYYTLTKSDIGLGSVNDAAQIPLSYLDTDTTLAANSDVRVASQKAVKTYVDTGLSGKEPTITAGTTGQYWRGDKTWQTLDKTAVGLGNVDNLQQIPYSYLDTDGTLFADSDFKVATQKATKTYADTKIAGAGTVVSDNIVTFDGVTGLLVKDSGYVLPAGAIVGTTDIQVLTNKDFTDPSNTLGGVTMNLGGDAIGDIFYTRTGNILTRLAGNTTTTKKFLIETGDGVDASAPSWDTVTSTDVGLGNVTNDVQIPASAFAALGDLLVGTGVGTYSGLTVGANNQVLMADNTTITGLKWDTLPVDGDVFGPATNTDSFIPQWNGTDTKILKDGLAFDIDGSLSANSDTTIASQKAVKTYADGRVPYTGATSDVILGAHSLQVDSTTFYADSVNHRVGVGTNAPVTALDLVGAMTYTAMTEPASPAADSVVFFVTASGTTPNHEVAFKIKFSDGTVKVLASILT